jgi:hypothetical protein
MLVASTQLPLDEKQQRQVRKRQAASCVQVPGIYVATILQQDLRKVLDIAAAQAAAQRVVMRVQPGGPASRRLLEEKTTVGIRHWILHTGLIPYLVC